MNTSAWELKNPWDHSQFLQASNVFKLAGSNVHCIPHQMMGGEQCEYTPVPEPIHVWLVHAYA